LSSPRFEAAMTEQKQKLASQREHMQTEHDLENQQLQHKIELKKKQHEQDTQLEKDKNDELVNYILSYSSQVLSHPYDSSSFMIIYMYIFL